MSVTYRAVERAFKKAGFTIQCERVPPEQVMSFSFATLYSPAYYHATITHTGADIHWEAHCPINGHKAHSVVSHIQAIATSMLYSSNKAETIAAITQLLANINALDPDRRERALSLE